MNNPPIEELIDLRIFAVAPSGYAIQTRGMKKLNKPELRLCLQEAMFVTVGLRIVNEVARYLLTKNKQPKTGQILQLGPWTCVEFKVAEDGMTVELLDVKPEEIGPWVGDVYEP